MNTPETHELEAAIAAMSYIESLKTGGAAKRGEYAEWLLRSPLHVRQFLLMTAYDRELEHFVPAALQPHRGEPQGKIIPFGASRAPSVVSGDVGGASSSVRQRSRMFAVAACLIVAIGITAVALWWAGTTPKHYVTAVGEQRKIDLVDGSLIQVNAASHLEVDYSRSARDVRLVSGEALFEVAHDAKRPFRVQVDSTVVRAVGTVFNVDRHLQHATVAVLEGRVKISSAGSSVEVSAGEIADITASGAVRKLEDADVAAAVAWREGRLIFHRETLATVAEEFNRYNRTPKLVVEGDSLRERRLSATFQDTNPQPLLEVLSSDPTLVVEHQDGVTVIRNRHAGDGSAP